MQAGPFSLLACPPLCEHANVLIKWGDIQKLPELERLVVPEVTRIVD
jgi:hypothetical protein